MTDFIMLCGLPASGKSTYAKEIAQKYTDKIVILSSDAIREELFGGVRRQDKNGKVFDEMYKRTVENLNNGIHVIYDATNINRKKRMNLLRELKKKCNNSSINYEVVALIKHIYDCVVDDSRREYRVGAEVIFKFGDSYQIPTRFEGWDDVTFKRMGNGYDYGHNKLKQPSILRLLDTDNVVDYGTFMAILNPWSERGSMAFERCIDFPQESKYHTLSLGRHIYEVYKYVYNNYFGIYREELLIASIYHDVGKVDTQKFDKKGENAKYAGYTGHEYVSAQKAFIELSDMVSHIDRKSIKIIIDLIQFHMDMHNETGRIKVYNLLPYDMYEALIVLHEADEQAR